MNARVVGDGGDSGSCKGNNGRALNWKMMGCMGRHMRPISPLYSLAH